MVYNMGADNLEVSVMEYQDDILTVKATDSIQVGGNDFDLNLLEYFKNDFRSRTQIDLYGNNKSLSKLLIQCEKVKRILSSANEMTLEIDYLTDEIDYVCKIKRSKFEDIN